MFSGSLSQPTKKAKEQREQARRHPKETLVKNKEQINDPVRGKNIDIMT